MGILREMAERPMKAGMERATARQAAMAARQGGKQGATGRLQQEKYIQEVEDAGTTLYTVYTGHAAEMRRELGQARRPLTLRGEVSWLYILPTRTSSAY